MALVRTQNFVKPVPTSVVIGQEYTPKEGLSQPVTNASVQIGMPTKQVAPIVVTTGATGPVTTYRFVAPFANSFYHLVITDQFTHAVVTPTTKTSQVITFTSVVPHVYTIYAVATS